MKGRLTSKNAPRGEHARSAKLTEADVRDIRSLYAAGGVGHKEIADRYGVWKTTITKLLAGKTWRHVK